MRFITSLVVSSCLFVSPVFAGVVTLHAMSEADGSRAHELVQAADGNFYGVTIFGGTNDSGTAFRMSPAGVFTLIATFDGSNGAIPDGGLTLGNDGNLYGTTYRGGSEDLGTVFRIQPGGALTTILSFASSSGMSHPNSTMALGPDGNFYGTTADGAIFQVTPDGVLSNWSGEDGTPQNLMFASDGQIYGTTLSNGASEGGSVFRLVPPGSPITLEFKFEPQRKLGCTEFLRR